MLNNFSGKMLHRWDAVRAKIDTYFVIAAVTSLLAGMTVAFAFDLSQHLSKALVIGLIAASILFVVIGFFLNSSKRTIAVLLGIFCVGIMHFSVAELNMNKSGLELGQEVEFIGMVTLIRSDDGYNTRFYVRPTKEYEFKNQVLVTAESQPLTYGDMVEIRGKVINADRPLSESNFDYDDYLRKHGVAAQVNAKYVGGVVPLGENKGNFLVKLAYNMRARIEGSLDVLTKEQAGYVRGMIFGDKSLLDSDQKDVLSQSGVMHVFAVSGLHVGYILALAYFLTRSKRIPAVVKFVIIAAFLFFYSAMTGFTPSVLRAAIMGLIGAFAYMISERKSAATAFFVAMGASLLFRPLWLSDAGFLMSYFSAAAIIFALPAISRMPKKLGWLGVSVAAQLGVMPLVAYYFNIITVGGLLLSPAALILTGIVVILGFFALPLSFIGLSDIVIYLAGQVAQILYNIAQWANGVFFLWKDVATPSIALIVAYFILFGILCLLAKKKKPIAAQVVALVVMLAVLIIPVASPTKLLEVSFVDVGQGDCIYIKTPEGQDILIDGGGQPRNPEVYARNVIIPFLQQRQVDDLELMVNTHPHADHVGGLLYVAREFPVEKAYIGSAFPKVELQKELETILDAKGVPVTYYKLGKYELEEGVSVQVLGPPEGELYSDAKANEGSLVLLVTYGDIDILLTGDLEDKELYLAMNSLPEPLEVDLLQLPHHGSLYSYDTTWQDKLAPQAVAISVGTGNKYGHPGPDVVNYWESRDIPIYRTDKLGTFTLVTDGERLAYRGNY